MHGPYGAAGWQALGVKLGFIAMTGAPALYAALEICQKEEGRKVSLREFLSWSVPFTLVASSVCDALGMLIWVLPFAR